MYKCLLSLILCSLSIGMKSSPADSIPFSSEFERSVFTKLINTEKIDSVEMFMALNYTSSDIKSAIIDFSKKLREKTDGYPDSKKLKTIYTETHNKFLTKYMQEAYFNDIFTNGSYNCVSASALYALILNELGIKYIIKQKPDHVYLIADPAKTQFLIETTLPGEKIVQFDERFRMRYVEYLYNNKVISDHEFNSMTVDELFMKNYTTDKTISLRNLAGLQYYNKGIFAYNKSLFNKAYEDFEKAFLLNQDEMVSFMRTNALQSILNNENQKKSFNGYYLAKYIAVNDSNNMGLQFANDFFNNVSSELVVNHPDIRSYRKYYTDLKRFMGNKNLDEIDHRYYFFLGYNAAVNFRYAEALAYLKDAYISNPDNINTKGLITECVTKKLINDRNHDMAIDSLNASLHTFPFLKNDQNILGYLEYCYAKTVEISFMYDETEKGLRRMKEYELFLKQYPDFEPDPKFSEIMYLMQASHYMRNSKYDTAEQILRKGIRKVPQSEDLKAALRSVMAFKGAKYEYPELMSDSKPLKKYLLAVATSKDNADQINENSAKYLPGKWQISKMIELGVEKEVPPELKWSLSLLNDKKAELITDAQKFPGLWNYNPAKCLLDINTDAKADIHIIITHISSARIRGVLYQKADYENSREILLTPLTDN